MMERFAYRLWGVRGSRPTGSEQAMVYGGNSTSIEFILPCDFHLFLDGGSGLVARGEELTEWPMKNKFYFLMTHTHWDHILGLPFFRPLYQKQNTFHFYASRSAHHTFESLFARQNAADNLAIDPGKIQASLHFHVLAPDAEINLEGKVTIKTIQLNHQGVTLGYRVSYHGHSICVITDTAPIEQGNYMGLGMKEQAQGREQEFEKEYNKRLVDFLRNADVVIFDTHFKNDQLKADWGHSTPQIALDHCIAAQVKKLVLFHHAPEDEAKDIKEKLQSIAQQAQQHGVKLQAAQEGFIEEVAYAS